MIGPVGKPKTSEAPVLWERRPNGKWKASVTMQITAHVDDADIEDADGIIEYLKAFDALITAYSKDAIDRVQKMGSEGEGTEEQG